MHKIQAQKVHIGMAMDRIVSEITNAGCVADVNREKTL
jgi:hypothetical protein